MIRMKKDDAQSRFGEYISVTGQIPLWSRRITLDSSDKSHPLSLERIKRNGPKSNESDWKHRSIVAFCRLFHCRNSLLFDQTRQILDQGLLGKYRNASPSILGGIGAQFVQSAASLV
jgi:hypothetical protein